MFKSFKTVLENFSHLPFLGLRHLPNNEGRRRYTIPMSMMHSADTGWRETRRARMGPATLTGGAGTVRFNPECNPNRDQAPCSVRLKRNYRNFLITKSTHLLEAHEGSKRRVLHQGRVKNG